MSHATELPGAAFGKHAEALADWALSRVVVRRDVYGRYTADGKQFTAHEPLTHELLVRHFRGEITIGAHSTSTDGRCLTVVWDIDAHDDLADPDANWRTALRAAELGANLGLDPLICDSNGRGGYHVRAFFRKPVAVAVAHWLGARVRAILAAEGLPPCEAFPKQGEVGLDRPFGNWLRLPGKHHKRPHWARIWHAPQTRWLEGYAAVQRLIRLAGDDPARVLQACQAEQDAQAKPATARRPADASRPTEDELRSALAALPTGWADAYGGTRAECAWLGTGMALHDWDSGPTGLALFHEFSRASAKYDPAACDAKWATFTAGSGVTIKTIYKAAYDNGWTGPAAPKAARRAEPAAARDENEDDVQPDVREWPAPPDDAAFRGVAGEIVRLIDPHSEADPVATLVQLLAGFGSLVGRNAYFQVESTRHYPNIFAGLVGRSSNARKGTSWDNVRRRLADVDPDWERDRIQSGLSSGEGLIWAVRDPITRREGLKDNGQSAGYHETVLDAGVDDKRLLVLENELGSTLKVLAREGNSLSGLIRLCWDSGNLRAMTKNSPARATGAHVSIVGHVTRDELERNLTDTEAANGFANRFLWVCVRRSKSLPFGGRLHEVDFSGPLQRLRAAAEHAREANPIGRDRAANRCWAEVYDDLSEPKPGLLGTVLGRAEAQTMRLACLYALLDASDAIRRDHLESALALWRYCERSARYIFGDRMGDPMADALLAALRSAPAGLTRLQIRDDVFSRNKSSAKIARTLGRLLEYGLAHGEKVDTGGKRPAELWYAVDAVNAGVPPAAINRVNRVNRVPHASDAPRPGSGAREAAPAVCGS